MSLRDAIRVALGSLVLWSMASTGTALEISHALADPPAFDPARGESTVFRFRLSRSARVRVHIYDGRDTCIRELRSEGTLQAGEHSVVWDGRDALDRPVPNEVYHYSIEAADSSPAGEPVVWDLSDLTGGERIEVRNIRWDREAGVIRYRLAKPGRVRIRLGLADGGPLLATVIDWVPRAAGAHAELWDGRDGSGVVDLSTHAKLEIGIEAFSLSRNHLLVGSPPVRSEMISDLETAHQRQSSASDERPRRMFDYASQQMDERRDFPVELSLLGATRLADDGTPVVDGPVSIQVDVTDADLARILGERFEIVYFVDGAFLFENEVGFLPVKWNWDPGGLPSGRHYLSINIRGYDGHFGIATRAVQVRERSMGMGSNQ